MPQPRRAGQPRGAQPQTRGVRAQRTPRTGGNTAVATSDPALALAGPTAGLVVAGGATGALTAAQIQRITAATLGALRRLSLVRRLVLGSYVAASVREVRPAAAAAEVQAVTREELDREESFRRRQAARMRRDLPRALRQGDAARRRARIEALLNRERVYSAQREEAAAERAAGRADAWNVRDLSPEGGFWTLGPRTTHTPACVALAGRAYPWGALEDLRAIPPLGPGCGCRLLGVPEVPLRGLAPEVPAVLDDLLARAAIRAALALEGDQAHGGGLTVGG